MLYAGDHEVNFDELPKCHVNGHIAAAYSAPRRFEHDATLAEVESYARHESSAKQPIFRQHVNTIHAQ